MKKRSIAVMSQVGSESDWYEIPDMTTEQIDAFNRELELLVDQYGGQEK